jgi:hypothetical protein
MHHGGMTVYGASSGGDYVIPAVKPQENVLLDSAQSQMAFHVNDILQGATG